MSDHPTPRRITLEETFEIRRAEFGNWYEDQDGYINKWQSSYTSEGKYKIWREVES